MIIVIEIIVYVLFGLLCIRWIFSGVKKIKEIRSEQAYEAEEKESIIPDLEESKTEDEISENKPEDKE